MATYRHVLAAIDFSEITSRVCTQASDIAQRYGASLTLVHVVEPIIVDPIYEVMPAIPVELELKQIEIARQRTRELGEKYGVPSEKCRVETGSTKAVIVHLAREIQADLIVLGSHGRHGINLLLGSTASAVMHSAPCDVLAVRIGDIR
jgi:universal stress protein A